MQKVQQLRTSLARHREPNPSKAVWWVLGGVAVVGLGALALGATRRSRAATGCPPKLPITYQWHREKKHADALTKEQLLELRHGDKVTAILVPWDWKESFNYPSYTVPVIVKHNPRWGWTFSSNCRLVKQDGAILIPGHADPMEPYKESMAGFHGSLFGPELAGKKFFLQPES